MAYSVDLAYVDYFKCAAEGKYDRGAGKDRLIVTAMSSGTAAAGALRFTGRLIYHIYEIAKVAFYSLAFAFTLGNFGNAKRLQDHHTLMLLNLGGLAAQAIQCLVHSVALFVGIASPKAAYRMMQGGSTPLAWITSQEQKVWQRYKTPEAYDKAMTWLTENVSKIFNKSSFAVQLSMKTILTEFSSALDAGLVAPLGYMEKFHIFDANPTTLTEEQSKMLPILLLNGNYSHQGTWLPLLHALKKSGNKRPVYTVNLPANCYKIEDTLPRLQEIKEQYKRSIKDDPDDPSLSLLPKNNFRIDIVGHSMGVHAISQLVFNLFDDRIKLNQRGKLYSFIFELNDEEKQGLRVKEDICVVKAIGIGTPNYDTMNKDYYIQHYGKESLNAAMEMTRPRQVYDILGKRDILNTEKGDLEKDSPRKKEVDTGHLGLLSHPEALQATLDFLQEEEDDL